MYRTVLILPVVLSVALACGCRTPAANGTEIARGAPELFRQAEEQAGAGDLQASLATVARALEAGYATPSDVLSSTALRPLRDDPVTRRALRQRMSRHARTSTITMVDGDEPGTPLELEIDFVDAEHRRPLEGAVVEIVHVDDRGLYQPSDLDTKLAGWNPRLFGYGRSDADGRVRVRTIRPAHYHPHYGTKEPAHVHLAVTLEGYRPWGGEILFADDERVDDKIRDDSLRAGVPLAVPVAGADGVQRAAVRLRLQPLD